MVATSAAASAKAPEAGVCGLSPRQLTWSLFLLLLLFALRYRSTGESPLHGYGPTWTSALGPDVPRAVKAHARAACGNRQAWGRSLRRGERQSRFSGGSSRTPGAAGVHDLAVFRA